MKVIKKKLTQRKGSGDSNDTILKREAQGSNQGTFKQKKESIVLINDKINPASPMTHRDETLLDFTDNQRSLIGRISIYKINFKKNLRRFQDIGNECARSDVQINQFVDRLLRDTPLPSVWNYNGGEVKQSQNSSLNRDTMNG